MGYLGRSSKLHLAIGFDEIGANRVAIKVLN